MKTIHPVSHWYCVDSCGGVDVDTWETEDLAKAEAIKNDSDWPMYAPHRAMQLVDATAAKEQRDELLEALKLADLLLSGANMNRAVVESKVRAAIAKAEGGAA